MPQRNPGEHTKTPGTDLIQKVDSSADALPGVKMSGVVVEIGNTPVNQGTNVLYTVHILLNNPDARLRWGMTMEVTFNSQK